ncbi:sigma-70 family RNA polymerase sigma factor [soil metagenome]
MACISTSSSGSGYAPAPLRTRTSRSTRPRRLHNVTVHEPFELVVARHGETVLRVCRAVLGPVDADDAWSATFLSALVAYPELAPDANVEAWLVTIAHRKAIDIVRAASRRAVPVDVLPERGASPGADARDLDLWAALAELPTKQRQVVAYHHLGGLPYTEIADLLGGTDVAARRAGADGIAALRRTYGTTAAASTSRRDP